MKRFFLLIFSVFLIAGGCLPRRSVPARYYILEYPAGLEVTIDPEEGPVRQSCLVNTVDIHPAYSTNQIAIKEDSHEIRYFAFNQWAVRPEQSFTALVVDFLNDYNIFQSVYSRPTLLIEPDYILETTIQHLVLTEEDNNHLARLSINYRLRDNKNDEVVLNHKVDRKQVIEAKNLNLFAAAISTIFIEELEEFTKSILAELR